MLILLKKVKLSILLADRDEVSLLNKVRLTLVIYTYYYIKLN